MALVMFEGFDQFDNTGAATQLLAKGFAAIGASYASAAGRFTGRALSATSSNTFLRFDFASALATATIGFAFQPSAWPAANQPIVFFTDAASTGQFGLGLTSAGKLCVFRGTIASLVATSTTGLTAGQWVYLEMQTTFHASAGAYEVKLNGTQVADLTASSVDTNSTANNSATGVYLGVTATIGVTFLYDDFYLTDTSTASNTGFLGEVRVTTIVPTGAGASTQFTPSTGSNWQNVDEIGTSGTAADTDYNSSSTAGHIDSFAISSSSISGSPAIYAVALNVTCRKDDVGTRTIRARVKSSAAIGTGTTTTVNSSYGTVRSQFLTDPNTTAAWSVAAVNAMEIGYELVS
jgi:hypothetical protein